MVQSLVSSGRREGPGWRVPRHPSNLVHLVQTVVVAGCRSQPVVLLSWGGQVGLVLGRVPAVAAGTEGSTQQSAGSVVAGWLLASAPQRSSGQPAAAAAAPPAASAAGWPAGPAAAACWEEPDSRGYADVDSLLAGQVCAGLESLGRESVFGFVELTRCLLALMML